VTGVRNVGVGDGYEIAYIRATPAPGSTLTLNDLVRFDITVKYALVVADKGEIRMIFQNQDDALVFPGQIQVSADVVKGSGEVTLSQDIRIPKGISELRLYVPIRPAGLRKTSGELLLTYPIKNKQ
jgi:hypothetical protein